MLPNLEYTDYGYGCYNNGYGDRLANTSKIHHAWTDGDDEPNFAWIVEFSDGLFAFVDGWHDYTGWDCKCRMHFHDADSYHEALRLAPDDQRRVWEEEKILGDKILRDQGAIR